MPTNSPEYMRAWHARNPGKQREYARRNREKDRQARRARQREWMRKKRAATPGYTAEQARLYRERHPGAGAENSRRYRANNPDHRARNLEGSRARGRRWAKEHPEYAREQCRKRRARLHGAAGHTTADQERARWEVCGRACTYCGTHLPWGDRSSWHFDHLIPLSRGGSNWPANLRPACATCNDTKGVRTYFEYSSEVVVHEAPMAERRLTH